MHTYNALHMHTFNFNSSLFRTLCFITPMMWLPEQPQWPYTSPVWPYPIWQEREEGRSLVILLTANCFVVLYIVGAITAQYSATWVLIWLAPINAQNYIFRLQPYSLINKYILSQVIQTIPTRTTCYNHKPQGTCGKSHLTAHQIQVSMRYIYIYKRFGLL